MSSEEIEHDCLLEKPTDFELDYRDLGLLMMTLRDAIRDELQLAAELRVQEILRPNDPQLAEMRPMILKLTESIRERQKMYTKVAKNMRRAWERWDEAARAQEMLFHDKELSLEPTEPEFEVKQAQGVMH